MGLVGGSGPDGPSGDGTRNMTSIRLSSISIRRTTVRMISCMPSRSPLGISRLEDFSAKVTTGLDNLVDAR